MKHLFVALQRRGLLTSDRELTEAGLALVGRQAEGSRRYPVPGCPGIVVWKSGVSNEWNVDDDGTTRTELVEATIVYAGEGDGPWKRKRDAIESVQTSYGLHQLYEAAGWPIFLEGDS